MQWIDSKSNVHHGACSSSAVWKKELGSPSMPFSAPYFELDHEELIVADFPVATFKIKMELICRRIVEGSTRHSTQWLHSYKKGIKSGSNFNSSLKTLQEICKSPFYIYTENI